MRTVAVIGGGLSGSLLALQLLRTTPDPMQVRLIDRDGAFGRGVAYSTSDDMHLLNVPATRMSAYPDAPDHFVDWLERRDGAVDPAGYVPRGVYGSYIREQLAHAGAAIELMRAEVVDIVPDGLGGRVHCSGGASTAHEHVVLATGSPVGAPPLELPDDPRVFANPWADGALRPHPAGHHTIIIGSGLTAIDVALSTTRLGASATTVSRHGLLPEQHRPGLHRPVPPASLPHGEVTLAEMERFVTGHIRNVQSRGGDWRDAFDGLRPYVPRLWGTLAPAARREFLRSRVRQWDVCRHRMAPSSARRIAALRADERLRVFAAPLGAVTATAAGLHVEVGGRVLRADRLVCCTGASRDVRSDPLVAQLVERGLVACDELFLGLRADGSGAMYDASGSPQPWLRTLGPLRRGELWETTAAEEIRAQAEMLARAILTRVRFRSAQAAAAG
jgi:uncharacterized NAD(P)/FAD-binding protein YdhS